MKKKSPAVCLSDYRQSISELRAFLQEARETGLSKGAITRCYDYALLSAYRTFEQFVLEVCIARINRDPIAFYREVSVEFGRHLTATQCEYLLLGDGYFDFRGHGGLIAVLRKASGPGSRIENNVSVPGSPMVDAAKAENHRHAFEILSTLRNYVAHESTQAARAALAAMKKWEPDRRNLGRAGTWLAASPAGQTRLERLLAEVDALCQSLADAA